MNDLLRNHLVSFFSAAPTLELPHGELLIRPTLDLVGATLLSNNDSFANTPFNIDLPLKSDINRYIIRNLKDPELSPLSIAQAKGVSRATLYRLFEPNSGVANQIKRRRLQRINQEIRDPRQFHHRITEIAYRWGFSDYNTFQRAFKQTFGMSPSEARHESELKVPDHASSSHHAPGADRLYEQWLAKDLLEVAC